MAVAGQSKRVFAVHRPTFCSWFAEFNVDSTTNCPYTSDVLTQILVSNNFFMAVFYICSSSFFCSFSLICDHIQPISQLYHQLLGLYFLTCFILRSWFWFCIIIMALKQQFNIHLSLFNLFWSSSSLPEDNADTAPTQAVSSALLHGHRDVWK